MNERIKELAERANIHFSRVGILDGDPNGYTRRVSYSKMEEFAKLIVKECGYHADAFNALGCPVDMATTDTKPSDYIKREMGVEE